MSYLKYKKVIAHILMESLNNERILNEVIGLHSSIVIHVIVSKGA